MKKFDYNLLDFMICKNVELLRTMNLFIWGAAEKGIQIKRTLNRIGISVIAFCDSAHCKQNRKCENIPVIGPDILKEEYQRDPGIVIILCVSNDMELLNIMDRMDMGSINLISYWGIKTACVIHQISLNPYAGLCEYDEIWQYKLRNNFKNLTAGYFLGKIKTNNPETIWILQVGKTASSTLERRLELSGLSYMKEHTLCYPVHVLNGELRSTWESVVKKQINGKHKIITAVREPLSRDYSAFWQAFSDGYENAYAMEILNKDIQVMYYKFIELLLSGYAYSANILKEAHPFCWRDEFEWFNEEIKTFFDIDVYESSFDRNKGYEIIEKNGISLFVFKVEKLDEISDELQNFIGKEMVCEDANRVDQKSYHLAYKEFRKKVRIPRKYVKHYYEKNKYMDHFYSPHEKEKFLTEWKGNIED